MSASRHAWLLGSADVCCLVDDTEAGDEFQLSQCQQLVGSMLNSFDNISITFCGKT